MHRISFITLFISAFLPHYGFTQRADVDDLTRELDLSILEKNTPPLTEDQISPAHLFSNWEALSLPDIKQGIIQKKEPGNLFFITLPADTYLVAPNPARIDSAYALLATARHTQKLKPVSPLKIVLHADGNFSLAIGLEDELSGRLPAGLDLSPLPEKVFAAVLADIQLIQKDHPPVLEAYLALKYEAEKLNLELDSKEFYFFPQSPGKVYFALPVKSRTGSGHKPNQE